LTKSVFVYIGW